MPDKPITPKVGFSGGCSEDIDAHALFAAELDQQYRQLGTGRFHASHQLMRLKTVTAFNECTYPALLERGWFEPARLALVFPVRASAGAWFCGQELLPGEVAVLDAPQEFLFRTPSQLQLGVLILQEEFVSLTFESPGERLVGRKHAVARSQRDLCVTEQGFASLMNIGNELAAADPAQAPSIECELLDRLQRMALHLVPEDDSLIRRDSHGRATGMIVSQALDVIHARIGEGVSVYDVCQALRVSRRYLQRCFERALDINPAQYILRQRLLAARSLLMKRRASTVATAAAEYGFWHLGRFANYYQKMFGETPSRTRAARS